MSNRLLTLENIPVIQPMPQNLRSSTVAAGGNNQAETTQSPIIKRIVNNSYTYNTGIIRPSQGRPYEKTMMYSFESSDNGQNRVVANYTETSMDTNGNTAAAAHT